MLLAGVLLTAVARSAGIDPAKSSVIATFRQENVPVDAPFTTFSGHIDYDPAQPGAARASIQVTTASLDLGDPEYNAEVHKKAWLDSGAFPSASFVSSAVKPGEAGKFEATGTLTLKGRTRTLAVPVTAGRAGAATSFDGEFAISRKEFGIGGPEWDDVLDDTVRVRFHLVE